MTRQANRDISASPRQQQLLDILADYSEPQPASVLARAMGYKHGVGRSVTYDLLGALRRKGRVRLTERGWNLR